jgi:lipid II isoglutaminyl synthase (glutamine-hydrolysing)
MLNIALIVLGKVLSKISKLLNLGSGSTWPGHITLSLNPNFIKELTAKNSELKIILVAGTNGKTTTSKLIRTILEKDNNKVFQNEAGANLLNGIASSLIFNSNLSSKINKDYAIFEIDENTLPLILKEIVKPDYIVILNLFRDQLDRYGEVNTIANKWREALKRLDERTSLILNADDPQIAHLGQLKNVNAQYFGINPKNATSKTQHASDSTYCPNCNSKLTYEAVYFSHLGTWKCTKCMFIHPRGTFNLAPFYPLAGAYNEYNVNAATLLSKKIGLNENTINLALREFAPAFGRQEKIKVDGKNVQILLSKNPTSLNESLRTAFEAKIKDILIVLNDRIPDGRDISWIWDVDFEDFSLKFNRITVSGDRTYDMALRLKYAEYKNVEAQENLSGAINNALSKISKNETLCILATYSAMLETRKVLTGRKIL